MSKHNRITKKLPISSHHKTGVLRAFKVIQKTFPPRRTPAEREVERFADHLRDNYGMREKSIIDHRQCLLDILRRFFQDGRLTLKSLTPAMVLDYIESLPKTRSNSIRMRYCGTLRKYISFLKMNGKSSYQIELGIPIIHGLPRVVSPITLSSEDMSQLLNSVDRSTIEGKTAYAIIMFLSELALRMTDVLRLSLDDIDWRSSKIKIPTPKNASPFYLPLTKRVGEALVDYIRYARPVSEFRQIFLRKPNSIVKTMSTSSLLNIMAKQWKKAGLDDRFRGVKILRHTTATNLVKKGFGLKVIADVLGHGTLASTSIYAQVDIPALRLVAKPWPCPEIIR
jgi:site-specific recombinase XerD